MDMNKKENKNENLIYSAIDSITNHFIKLGFLSFEDVDYARNRVFRVLDIQGKYLNPNDLTYTIEEACNILISLDETLDNTTKKDNFIAEITDCFVGMPSSINKEFFEFYNKDKEAATNWLYGLCRATLYIKDERNKQNIVWKGSSKYGELDITVNMAKPEKTPEEIALQSKNTTSDYPKCMLCKENVGLNGIYNPPRAHHRIIPIKLQNEDYFMQYSPYSYFNEHLIVLSKEHTPMVVNSEMLPKMMDFTKQFPHYFLSSNADLPIVGGSILSHDHFQGGRYVFPMEKSSVARNISKGLDIMNWPVSTIRFKGSREEVLSMELPLLEAYLKYENKELGILNNFSEENTKTNANTKVRNNTVNYFVRYEKETDTYTVYMLLRNNSLKGEEARFHTRQVLRAIKRENIGIIETIGLAILPKRLKQAMENDFNDEFFSEWKKYIDPSNQLSSKEKIQKTYELILEDVGVFKQDNEGLDALSDFIKNNLRSV